MNSNQQCLRGFRREGLGGVEDGEAEHDGSLEEPLLGNASELDA